MRTSRVRSFTEKSWAARFAIVTVLSGVFAVVAHLAGGGVIASTDGLVLGALSSNLVSMVALYRTGFWRVFAAMTVGQFAFHTFMGVGATGTAHHSHGPEPLMGSGLSAHMSVSHLVAAFASALVVSEADRALRALTELLRALRDLAGTVGNQSSLPVTPRLPLRGAFHYQPLESEDLVGSQGLRGPPSLSFSA
jgi:hypothetical protein